MLHEISFPSYNGRDQVQGWIYVPACKPRGIVQLIHGFGEHSRRYFHMIVKYLDAGFIVAADAIAQVALPSATAFRQSSFVPHSTRSASGYRTSTAPLWMALFCAQAIFWVVSSE